MKLLVGSWLVGIMDRHTLVLTGCKFPGETYSKTVRSLIYSHRVFFGRAHHSAYTMDLTTMIPSWAYWVESKISRSRATINFKYQDSGE